jgi:glycosyltransferase involved in cell wall biosynthesis
MGRNAVGRATAWQPHRRESRLVLDVASGRPVPPDRRITEVELTSAARHGLLGLLANSDHPHLAAAAIGSYARLSARQQVMERVLRHVLERLTAGGVRATVVKGPALARWAYGNPRHRTFTDLDLVVPAREVAAALDVLRDDEFTVGIPPKTPKADKRNIPLADPSGVRFTLDLHWDLFSYTQLRGCADGAVESAWSSAVWESDHPLGPMWRLPEETLVAFLATHALLDHRFRLILFRDLAEVAARGVEWERLVEFSHRYGLRSTGYTAWRIAAETVDAEISAEVLASLRPRSLPIAVTDRRLPRTDLVDFDGHSPDLLNLALVLLHDKRTTRVQLMATAPFAFPEWLRRVERGGETVRSHRTDRPRQTPRRVLHLLPLDVARGAQTYAKAIRDLLDNGDVEHRTAIIFQSESSTLDADVDLQVSPVLGRRVGFSPVAALRLWRYLRRVPPSVVVAHGGEALKYAALVTPRSTRLAYYKIGAAGTKLDSWWRRQLYRWLVARTDLVAGVSSEMLAESDVMLAVPAGRTVLIPNGRDPDRFVPRSGDTSADEVVFALVGRLDEGKRPLLFLDLIAELRRRGVTARGVVVGDGPLLGEVQERADDTVDVLGRRDDVPELLAGVDVLVLVSVHEGMPGVLIEAGMAGIPAVTTDVEGARAVIEDGVTGLIVPDDDFASLVEAAESLARDPELRSRMGESARRRCVERFTLEASARRWAEELEGLMIQVDR